MNYALLLLILVTGSPSAAQEPRLALSFIAADSDHSAFAEAARGFWESDGVRIVKTMERVSGLRFRDSAITVIMSPRAASSGAGGISTSPLRLDIRYPIPMSLIHELGHRLSHQLLITDESAPRYSRMPAELNTGHAGLDGHKLLYLYLYEIWEHLYGIEVANRWREVERGWAELGFGFIRDAWDWSDSLGPDGRAAKMRGIVAAQPLGSWKR
ncbi:MAG TPA: hypothetical protein VMO26_18910 [Vicinamibacterales bacterium]|nr:hypothetical protein [Vicinamibacterales bacterium]